MQRLSRKIAVVTGGAAGIGRACVERFLAEGARVALIDVNERACAAVSEAIDNGETLRTYVVDVSKETQVKDAIDSINRDFGGIDILVNNAGVVRPWKSTHEVSEEEWDALQGVNTKGVFFATKHTLPIMMHRNSGSIVNLCSVAAILSFGGIAPYHAAKGAVLAMTKNDAMDYAKYKIRVNAVLPGWILTDMVRDELRSEHPDYDEALRAATALQPLNMMGGPEDVAAAVLYLASDEARYVTGADIVIDGGYSAR